MFGQTEGTAFGMKINFGISSVPMFGGNSVLPIQNSSNVLSGGLLNNSTSITGFRQTSPAQTQFGGFGNTNTTPFNAQQTTNAFATNAFTPSLNQTNNQTGFTFNPFNQSQQSNNPFARTNNSTPGFFNSPSAFEDTSGTVVKFSPVIGTDVILNRGLTQTIQVLYWCINLMKEYEEKSLEELRFEDYKQGRKGPQTQTSAFPSAPAPGTLLPGSSATSNQSAFSNKSFSFSTPSSNNPFATSSSNSLFPANTPSNSVFKIPLSSGFLPPDYNPSSGLFNQPKPTSLWPNSATSLFPPKSNFLPGNTSQNLFKTSGFFVPPSTNFNNSFNTVKPSFPSTSFAPSLNYRPLNFPSSSAANQTQNPVSIPIRDQILGLMTTPFGDSPLLRNIQASSRESEHFAKSKSPFTVHKPTSRTQYKISTNNHASRIKPKTIGSGLTEKALFDSLELEDSYLLETFQVRPSAKRLVLRAKRPSNISKSAENVDSNENKSASPDETTDKENREIRSFNSDSTSSTSWLKVSLNRNKRQEEKLNQFPVLNIDDDDDNDDDSIAELRPHASSLLNFNISPIRLNAEDSSDSANSSPDEPEVRPRGSDGIARKAQVKLERREYYTIPPLDKLDEYVRDGTCVVPDFTVGRRGYGKVRFAECDIFGLNLDEIVHFQHKEVLIYPDDARKPPIGQGLNRRARVTLDRVWPNDRTNNEPITDVGVLAEMNYVEKLKRVSEKHNTSFLEYEAKTGSWIFQVEHF